MGRMLEILVNGSVVIAAMVMVGLYVHDRWGGNDTSVTLVHDWKEISDGGIRVGPADARVVITEFIDFECPFCRAIAPTLDSILSRFEGEVAVVYHHFPLPGHPNALPAAVAAECAHQQGAAGAFISVLLAGQDSLGIKPWGAFAAEAGVADPGAFEVCTSLPPERFPRIAAGQEHGHENGVNGTPTIWVNGRVVNPRGVLAEVAEVLGAP